MLRTACNEKKALSFGQCFVPGAFHGQALTDVLLTSCMLVEPHLLKKHCPVTDALKTHNHIFFYTALCDARGGAMTFICFVLFFVFFSRPIFGTAAGAVKYKNSFSPEFYFTHNGTVQIKNTLSRILYLPHEL